MSNFIIIRDAKSGHERRVSKRSYDLLSKTARERLQVVGEAPDQVVPSAVAMDRQNGFLPPEIAEMVRNVQTSSETKAAAEMISGEAISTAAPEPPQKPKPAEAKKPAAPVAAPPSNGASSAAQAQPQRDDLASLPQMGAKAAEALAAVGITTFKALAEASTATVNKAMEDANLSPKKAQVPGWKQAAAKLAKA